MKPEQYIENDDGPVRMLGGVLVAIIFFVFGFGLGATLLWAAVS